MKTFLIKLIFCLCFVPFLLSAQTPMELKSYLPELDGWEIAPEIEIFNRSNLYERINGAAPLFLENNFIEMTSMMYSKSEDYIIIQAYRHATPVDAFGMYASERSTDMEFFQIGGEAQGDDVGLYCFAGSIYLKMQANNGSESIAEAMRTIAKGLMNNIDPNADYPDLFKKFPAIGKIPHTEAYLTSNYMGHEFLKNVFTCNYDFQGKQFQLFMIDAKTTEGAKAILNQYFEFTKQTNDFTEGILVIKDRYNGDISFLWKGQYVAGIFDEKGTNTDEYSLLLSKLAENMK